MMGEAAVQLILQLQKRTDTISGQRIVLKTKLMVRESSLHGKAVEPTEKQH